MDQKYPKKNPLLSTLPHLETYSPWAVHKIEAPNPLRIAAVKTIESTNHSLVKNSFNGPLLSFPYSFSYLHEGKTLDSTKQK